MRESGEEEEGHEEEEDYTHTLYTQTELCSIV